MDSPYAHELKVAFGALQNAAGISRSVLAEADLGTLAKDDLSPVTIADFAIQALLTATIHAAFPGDRFVGEESAAELRANPALLARVWDHLQRQQQQQQQQQQQIKAADGSGDDETKTTNSSSSSSTARRECRIPASPGQACEMIDWCGSGVPGGPPGSGSRVWVFDPIDGTQNFVRGQLYATNIALLEGGKQVLGAVGCPNLAPDAEAPVLDSSLDPRGSRGGCIVFAVRGHGTHVRALDDHEDGHGHGDGGGALVRTIPRHAAAAAAAAEGTAATELRCVTSRNALASGLEDVHAAAAARLGMAFPGCNLLPWVVRWAVLGLGLANTTYWAYVGRGRRAKAWDHAGAMLLFEEVGGRVTDVDGRDIDLAAGRTLDANYGFVAAPAGRHAEVLTALREAIREDGRVELLPLAG